MRFFLMACTFCMLIASLGCMTNNWSSPLFNGSLLQPDAIGDSDAADNEDDADVDEEQHVGFWKSKFGESSGVDPRARAIEKRFGL